MKPIIVLLGALLLFALNIKGQTLQKNKNENDTTSLLYAFKKGKTEGHFRLFFMGTDNMKPLTDYYAMAFGGGLKYQTKNFKGFQLGVSGFYIWNILSSDLTITDPTTNSKNRYEIGQFDQEDPTNKKNLQRLEDFNIRYNFKNSFARYGKQVIKTPFINPQDGRMRPTGQEGLWAEINEIKNTKIELGWINHISPRGTMKWYSGANSIGVYSPGVNIDGTKSNYRYNLRSRGIVAAGVTQKISPSIKLQIWDHWVENIFNTALLQADGEFPVSKKEKIIAGIQYIHQDAVNNGGNTDPDKTYFDPSQSVNIYGLRIGYQWTNTSLKFNYTRITKDGRFLFPREWGREPFYTFMARERNEGLGDVNAFTINFSRGFIKKQLVTELSAGYYELPDVKNFRLNKYGLPSYYQFNVDLKYSLYGLMQGLNAELLYLYKIRSGNMYNDLKYVINKVDMQQLNIILNYNF